VLAVVGLAAGILAAGSASAQPASNQTEPQPLPQPREEPDTPAPTTEPQPEPKINLTGQKRPMIDLTTPPPSAPEGRTYHEHEGFSLRLDVGIGALLSASSTAEGLPDANTGGLTFDYDLQIGGAPSPGIVLGGALTGKLQLSGDWEVDDFEVGGGNLNTIVIGPFFDGYPNPHGNLHFGGTVGFARLGADTGAGSDSLSALGVGGAFWAGSGVWVAPDWSIGGALRLDAAWGKDDDTTLSAVGMSLMFSLLYN
jgi:hypothetical protein